jgi:hypothetical protein
LDELRRFPLIAKRTSSGAGPAKQISFISQISGISVPMPCVAGGEHRLDELRRFPLIAKSPPQAPYPPPYYRRSIC